MKIALLTLGTRGDVQAFAVLGRALKARGHEVTISSAGNFAGFIDSYELNFVPVDADFQEIVNSDEGKKIMSNPFSARKHLNRLIYPMIRDAMMKFHDLSKENEVVLFHVKAMADYYADGLNCKFIRANVVPAIQPTSEFINPIISFSGLPSFMNRISYKLSELGMTMMSKPINQFRKELGLTNKYKKAFLGESCI
jgi:sterol 3beta-glucosyltransferase